MGLVSSADGLFAVLSGTVHGYESSEQDLDKNRIVLPVRRVAALSAEEIEHTDARGEESAENQKPKKNIVAVHVGLRSELAGQTATDG